MATVTVLFRATARQGEGERVRSALTAAVQATRAEPGCISYELSEDADDPNTFTSYERWADEEALQEHARAPHVGKLAALWPLLIQSPEEAITRLTPLPA